MGRDFSNFDLQQFIITMGVLVLAITIHEFAHAITADRLGDPTPRRDGRISLFPTDHLDPIGTMMMFLSSLFGVGIGWGKPVMTNPGNFRSPRRDSAIVAIAGPISNILQAIVFAVILRLLSPSEEATPISSLLQIGVLLNLCLAFFNLIPIAPLDGHWIMAAILPHEVGDRYMHWMRMYGPMIFIGLVLIFPRVLWQIYGPVALATMRFIYSTLGL